jgi:hypothetical protein
MTFLIFKETIMDTADVLIHIHPELDVSVRTNMSRKLEGHIGIECAEFNHHAHPHVLVIKFDPNAITSMQILNIVRESDPMAALAGL